eukprot:GHVT01061900.1.p1 GENE.GHVT01061900.1~~GHVT01061900.1.p1  ORF type:complete len:106 (+),score=2.47 GHVT01061900.1:959-1276(+)
MFALGLCKRSFSAASTVVFLPVASKLFYCGQALALALVEIMASFGDALPGAALVPSLLPLSLGPSSRYRMSASRIGRCYFDTLHLRHRRKVTPRYLLVSCLMTYF